MRHQKKLEGKSSARVRCAAVTVSDAADAVLFSDSPSDTSVISETFSVPVPPQLEALFARIYENMKCFKSDVDNQ